MVNLIDPLPSSLLYSIFFFYSFFLSALFQQRGMIVACQGWFESGEMRKRGSIGLEAVRKAIGGLGQQLAATEAAAAWLVD